MSGSEVIALLVIAFGVMIGDAFADGRIMLAIVLAVLLVIAAFEWRRRN
jgi:hypothetical protein